MADITVNAKSTFFSQRNELMLDKLLTDDFQRRLGTSLSDKESSRLNNTVAYYMKQVYENPDNSRKSLQEMNREVLKVVVPDFQSYIRRQQATAPVLDPVRADVSSQYDKLQAARQESQAKIPAPPNFQLSLDDSDATPSIQRYEQLKQQREMEARRLEEAQNTLAPMNSDMLARREDSDDMAQMIQSDDDFRAGQRDAIRRDATILSAREADRARQRLAAGQVVRDVPPDPRILYLGDQGTLPARSASFPNANPTLALPNSIQTRPSLPQDIIKPQSDIVTYKENEYNLSIYSGDRDWVNNTLENRYNFTVNFDPANNKQGFGLSPSTYIKFKNIARIELVKAIMPTEGLETVSLKTSQSVYDTSKIINVLSFPYLQVRIDELNTNNYGTNDGLNNSFGVINYDAYWTSDSHLKNKGYTCMIPKFLKCQKIYHPTPLSTLQKLSIQIQRPDGSLVTSDSDALDISGVVLSSMLYNTAFGWGGTYIAGLTYNANYSGTSSTTSSEYIWIQTKNWFSQFSVTQGDRIVLNNLAYNAVFTGTIVGTTLTVASSPTVVRNILPGMTINTAAGGTIVSQLTGTTGKDGTYLISTSQTVSTATVITATTVSTSTPVVSDFLTYLQRPAGHIVVDVGQGSSPNATFVATASTTTLTVSSVTSGTISVGMTFFYGTAQNTITAFLTGSGSSGTYTLANSVTIGSATTIVGTAVTTTIVCSASTTTLTVTSVISGTIAIGMLLNTATGGPITAQLTGTPGGVGTYTITSQTIAVGTTVGLTPTVAVFTGNISTFTLTVASLISGAIVPGMTLNTSSGGTIVTQLTGTTGGVGTYTISVSQTVTGTPTIVGTGPCMNFQDGANGSNKLGYSNYIIIRNNFSDPTTGATAPVALNSSLGSIMSVTPSLSSGRLLNTSHQIQLVFRIITRDMDSSVRLRPDNL